ncbi:MAG TPA: hypothetical protein PLB59_10740 [Bacteroidales bacterium]|nr:hypothetical protein [Bacteroidales bacterium]HPB26114.1 hypothetical protein [Bacteroidales bacterium]HPI29972.1 hypothetical protein [Bacteroidales bacterium]HQN16839.1 hypothetical protein [Bacteroidales bacterium]HQP16430.1 hypothetical protein [Bacteroidales bacterium]
MKKNFLVIIVFILVPTIFVSCKKDPGEGGTSSIYGKVYMKDYNSTYTVLLEEYYAQDVDVYIIYGDDKTYSERIRTNYDGTYEFKYLRKGTYHVYVYSEDSTLQTNAMIPVIRDVEITKNNQEVEAEEIIIYN